MRKNNRGEVDLRERESLISNRILEFHITIINKSRLCVWLIFYRYYNCILDSVWEYGWSLYRYRNGICCSLFKCKNKREEPYIYTYYCRNRSILNVASGASIITISLLYWYFLSKRIIHKNERNPCAIKIALEMTFSRFLNMKSIPTRTSVKSGRHDHNRFNRIGPKYRAILEVRNQC